MRKILACFAFIAIAQFTATAQEWHTNFEEAKELANKSEKLIIVVFQGSDWCAPCMKLDHEIWSTDVFKAHASENFVLVKVDFPRRKKNALSEDQKVQNAELSERYNTRGIFPYVVILDNIGNIHGATGYKQMSPEEYIKHLSSFISKT